MKNNYKIAQDKYDYYTFFMEKSIKIAKNNFGIISLITTSTYLMKPLS